jgi:hypothetical protein
MKPCAALPAIVLTLAAWAFPGPAVAQLQLAGDTHTSPHAEVDVNRPRSPFDCELPIGVKWYGSQERCLAYLCEGYNVYNEYIFDAHNRRRKNPCYGQSPTNFPDQ